MVRDAQLRCAPHHEVCSSAPLALEAAAHAGLAQRGAAARRDRLDAGTHLVERRLARELARAFALALRLDFVPGRDAHLVERGLVHARLPLTPTLSPRAGRGRRGTRGAACPR